MRRKVPPNVLWPTVIAGALVVHVVASLITVWVATSNPSYAVEDDYYQKAVAWDQRRAQERHNAELGWRLDFSLDPSESTASDPLLVVRLSAADGAPVTGATVTVAAFHNARANEILRSQLAATGAGEYSSRLSMRRSGLWELRFVVDRGGERFTHTETRYMALER